MNRDQVKAKLTEIKAEYERGAGFTPVRFRLFDRTISYGALSGSLPGSPRNGYLVSNGALTYPDVNPVDIIRMALTDDRQRVRDMAMIAKRGVTKRAEAFINGHHVLVTYQRGGRFPWFPYLQWWIDGRQLGHMHADDVEVELRDTRRTATKESIDHHITLLRSQLHICPWAFARTYINGYPVVLETKSSDERFFVYPLGIDHPSMREEWTINDLYQLVNCDPWLPRMRTDIPPMRVEIPAFTLARDATKEQITRYLDGMKSRMQHAARGYNRIEVKTHFSITDEPCWMRLKRTVASAPLEQWEFWRDSRGWDGTENGNCAESDILNMAPKAVEDLPPSNTNTSMTRDEIKDTLARLSLTFGIGRRSDTVWINGHQVYLLRNADDQLRAKIVLDGAVASTDRLLMLGIDSPKPRTFGGYTSPGVQVSDDKKGEVELRSIINNMKAHVARHGGTVHRHINGRNVSVSNKGHVTRYRTPHGPWPIYVVAVDGIMMGTNNAIDVLRNSQPTEVPSMDIEAKRGTLRRHINAIAAATTTPGASMCGAYPDYTIHARMESGDSVVSIAVTSNEKPTTEWWVHNAVNVEQLIASVFPIDKVEPVLDEAFQLLGDIKEFMRKLPGDLGAALNTERTALVAYATGCRERITARKAKP